MKDHEDLSDEELSAAAGRAMADPDEWSRVGEKGTRHEVLGLILSDKADSLACETLLYGPDLNGPTQFYGLRFRDRRIGKWVRNRTLVGFGLTQKVRRSGHPLQPIHIDGDGRPRFRGNRLVQFLLDNSPIDLNRLHRMDFSAEDHAQLAMLIGYSVDGFGELSYVPQSIHDEVGAVAEALARVDP